MRPLRLFRSRWLPSLALASSALLLPGCSEADHTAANPRTDTTTVRSTLPTAELCAAADRLREAKLLQDALDRYISAGGACDGGSDRIRELGADLATAEALVSEATRVAATDALTAEQHYLKALQLNAGSEQARAGLTDLFSPGASQTTTTTPGFGAAQQLRLAGYRNEAQAATVAAIKSGADFTALGEDEQRELDYEPGGIATWRKYFSDAWGTLPFVMGVLAAIGLPLLWIAQSRVRGGNQLQRSAFLRKWLGTRLQFTTGVGTGVEAVGAQMRHLLRLVSVSNEPSDITVNSATDDQIDIPDLGTFDRAPPANCCWNAVGISTRYRSGHAGLDQRRGL